MSELTGRKYYPSPSMYIGETLLGVPSPVFYDPNTGLGNGATPITLITGASGSGKTTAAQLICANQAILGKTVVVFDYKGDMAKLGFLADELDIPTRIWNLGQTRKNGEMTNAGVLDPMILTEDPKRKYELTVNFVQILIGEELSRSDRNAISPIIQDVIESDKPTMMNVVNQLRQARDSAARNVGNELNNIRSLNYGSLCFYSGPKIKRPPKINDGGLTIATLAGMRLPTSKESATDTQSGRLINGILYLLTDYISMLLADDDTSRPKTFMIDEAWAFLGTKQGQDAVRSVALMGRSKRLSTILITQSPSHIPSSDIEDQISSRFAFQAKDSGDSKKLAKGMKLPVEQFSELLQELQPQCCLYSDWKGDYAIMRFNGWKKEWMEILTTNPEHLAEIRKRKQALQREIERQSEIER